jgi:hypothetical protein
VADRSDREWEQERHQRRMMLMRMQGETNRLETRVHRLWFVAVVLGFIALVLAFVT